MALRHRAHRIAYVPMDDRPCNARLPRLLARMVDFELLVPPPELLGSYDRAGQPDGIADWLLEPRARMDSAIISLDMLCYGGLVASRTPTVATETALERLALLKRLREDLGEAAIYAFNVIMRLSITADSPQTAEYWELMRQYTELSDRLQRLGESQFASRVRDLERRIPSEVIDNYEAARRRNHAINRRAIEEVAEGNLDFLALTQEDAAEFGAHLPEQEALAALVDERGVGDKVMIYPGADEAGMTLLARFIHEHMLKTPTVRVIYSSEQGADRIATFEDRPFRETVDAHIKAIHATACADDREPDLTLAVVTPEEGARQDYVSPGSAGRERRRQELRDLLRHAAQAAGRHVVVCDAAFPNGADELFMRELRRSDLELHRLLSFAAWNTAGNSVGSALAHGTLRLIALQDKGAFDLAQLLTDISPMRYLELLNSLLDAERAHVEFLFTRLTDDWLYQTRVRPAVTEQVVNLLQASVFNLADSYRQTERMVGERLMAEAHDLWADHFLARETVKIGVGENRSSLVFTALEGTHVRLPWRRLFEVDLDFDFGLELVAGGE